MAQDKAHESGRPGDGAGRKDEVGHSGIYPMSGPLPTGDAPIVPEASFGQGERGAAGYEDHGGSELEMVDGQVLGGLTANVSGAPGPESQALDQEQEQQQNKRTEDLKRAS